MCSLALSSMVTAETKITITSYVVGNMASEHDLYIYSVQMNIGQGQGRCILTVLALLVHCWMSFLTALFSHS